MDIFKVDVIFSFNFQLWILQQMMLSYNRVELGFTFVYNKRL